MLKFISYLKLEQDYHFIKKNCLDMAGLVWLFLFLSFSEHYSQSEKDSYV